MLYYNFVCKHCHDERTFSGKEYVDHIVNAGYHQCGVCDNRTEIDPDLVFDDGNPETSSYEESDYYSVKTRDDNLPTIEDMSVVGADLEGLEDWQKLILDEFEASDELTYDPKATYTKCLNYLRTHQFGWVKFGVWAFHFKLKRYYRDYYKTWKQFCEKELHQSHWYIDKLIKAARVMKDLILEGFTVLPQNEYQCRPLTKFWGETLIENWSKVEETVPPHLITSDLINSLFAVREKKEEKWVKVPAELWEKFEYKTRQHGVDPKEALKEILDEWEGNEDDEELENYDDNKIEEVDEEKLNTWREDLTSLINERFSLSNWFVKFVFWSLFNGNEAYLSGIP